jgi:hypothetical protein
VKVSRVVRSGSLVGVGQAGLPPAGLRTFETVDAPPVGILVRPAGAIVHDRTGTGFWLNLDGTAAGWIWSADFATLWAVRIQLLTLAANATAINAIGNDAFDAYAVGTVSFPQASALVDHDNFTMPNGAGGFVTFEYRKNGPGWVPVAGRITIDLVLQPLGTPHDVAVASRAAIALNTSLVYLESGVGVGVEWVRWQYPVAGLLGNQPISGAVGSGAFAVTGFQYGSDGIVPREARRRVAYIGAPATAVDVTFPTPLQRASGYRVTFRGTTSALGADQALSLRIMGVGAGISRSGYFAFVGSAPSAFGDGTGNLVTVKAGYGYDIEIEVPNPRAADRPGGLVVLFVRMQATRSGTTPIAFFGWFTANLGVGINLGSVGLATSVANGIPATATYQLEVM